MRTGRGGFNDVTDLCVFRHILIIPHTKLCPPSIRERNRIDPGRVK